MQKIMFNEKYGLQRAAIAGTKPMTRRLVPEKWQTQLTEIFEACNFDYSKFWQHPTVQLITNEQAPYKVGEVVAIAQSYKNIYPNADYEMVGDEFMTETAGWNNKMFVKAELMPHRIRITDIKVERLQDISDEDCMKEGIFQWRDMEDCPKDSSEVMKSRYGFYGVWDSYVTPREAFADLIDKVSGRGTWDSNPWVFAYSFELIK